MNFEDRPVCIGVNIPAHAFDYLAIPEKKYTSTDLLSSKRKTYELTKDGSLALSLESRGAAVIKIKL